MAFLLAMAPTDGELLLPSGSLPVIFLGRRRISSLNSWVVWSLGVARLKTPAPLVKIFPELVLFDRVGRPWKICPRIGYYVAQNLPVPGFRQTGNCVIANQTTPPSKSPATANPASKSCSEKPGDYLVHPPSILNHQAHRRSPIKLTRG
jgi:hypothetical protein